MSEPTKDLNTAISDALMAQIKKNIASGLEFTSTISLARVAIETYEAHRPRPVVVLSREEWEAGIDLIGNSVKLRDYRIPLELDHDILQTAILGAFRWIKVEND